MKRSPGADAGIEDEMKIVNLTPHAITIEDVYGVVRIIEPTFPIVHIRTDPGPEIVKMDGIAIHGPSAFLGISGLPQREQGTIYVVSQLAALAIAELHPERDDVVYPGTAIADEVTRIDKRVAKIKRLIRAI